MWTLTCDPLKHKWNDVLLKFFTKLSVGVGEYLAVGSVHTLCQKVGEILHKNTKLCSWYNVMTHYYFINWLFIDYIAFRKVKVVIHIWQYMILVAFCQVPLYHYIKVWLSNKHVRENVFLPWGMCSDIVDVLHKPAASHSYARLDWTAAVGSVYLAAISPETPTRICPAITRFEQHPIVITTPIQPWTVMNTTTLSIKHLKIYFMLVYH